MYFKYYPSAAFSCQRHYCTTLTTNLLQPLISRKQAAPADNNFLVILSGAQAESKNLVEVAARRDHSTTLSYSQLPSNYSQTTLELLLATLAPLAECYVEYHHHHKADGKGHSARIGVFALLRLGDKLLDNDIEHCSRREGEKVG